MKLCEAQEGSAYFVIKGSSCGTLQSGDSIQIDRGDLMCMKAGGWLPRGEWEDLDVDIAPKDAFFDGLGI